MREPNLTWCLSKKDRLKIIKPDLLKSSAHLKKAKHNLLAAHYNLKGGFEDWVVSQCYYSVYHVFLSLLYKYGFESRNHECTIKAVEFLIKKKNLPLDMKYIYFIKQTGELRLSDAKGLREEFQYGTKTKANKEILNNLINTTKEIIEAIELISY
jgi:uncharacterized protein (UPF0332 family)